MAWTGIARPKYSRKGPRYSGDMTEREWQLAAPFIPPAKRGGRRRTTATREVVNALLYIAASGRAWRLLPKCLPPASTVQRYFYAWRNTGLLEAMNTELAMNLREIEGREASPSRCDRQSVGEYLRNRGPCGYDAGKKIAGRKRHIPTDIWGFLIVILVNFALLALPKLVSPVRRRRDKPRRQRRGRGLVAMMEQQIRTRPRPA